MTIAGKANRMIGLGWLWRLGTDRLAGELAALQRRVEELQAAERRYRDIIDALPVMMVYSVEPTPPHRAFFLSRGHETLGYSREEWMDPSALWLRVLHPDDREWVTRETELALARRDIVDYEYRAISKAGEVRWLRDRGRFVFDEAGRPIAWQGYMMDITERRQLEEELRQAQKMEALGRLSGEIAHDFNNLLSVIGSYVNILLEEVPAGTQAHHDLIDIRATVERGAALTSQLLTFSRRRVPEVKRIDVDAVIRGGESMARALLGPEIELVLELGVDHGTVDLESGQLDQVLVNLLVNAAEAMPDGGRLSVSTKHMTVGAPGLAEPTLPPGEYTCLEVSDTGSGMDRETAARALDPFFTTKQAQRCTGLGLSTVYGIVKQAGGGISLRSTPGAGTTVTVLLPRTSESVAGTGAPAPPATPPPLPERTAGGRILLVDDEDGVRVPLTRMLTRHGYDVVMAANGLEAVRAWEAASGAFALLITDIRMPGMSGHDLSGHELVQRVREQKPDLPVILMSAYPEDPLTTSGMPHTRVRFLTKPFEMQDLLANVNATLAGC